MERAVAQDHGLSWTSRLLRKCRGDSVQWWAERAARKEAGSRASSWGARLWGGRKAAEETDVWWGKTDCQGSTPT